MLKIISDVYELYGFSGLESSAIETVDALGKFLPDIKIPGRAVVGGDGLEEAISAASIVAKVYRDQYMKWIDRVFPGYAFGRHKGYPTRIHLDALQSLGPCAVHRRSFAPVKAVIS